MFDKIEEKGTYSELEASEMIGQVLEAVAYMHSQVKLCVSPPMLSVNNLS